MTCENNFQIANRSWFERRCWEIDRVRARKLVGHWYEFVFGAYSAVSRNLISFSVLCSDQFFCSLFLRTQLLCFVNQCFSYEMRLEITDKQGWQIEHFLFRENFLCRVCIINWFSTWIWNNLNLTCLVNFSGHSHLLLKFYVFFKIKLQVLPVQLSKLVAINN